MHSTLIGLGGVVAAESDHGNTTVRAPPATASSADPEESKKVRTGLTTLLSSKTCSTTRSFTRTSAKCVAVHAVPLYLLLVVAIQRASPAGGVQQRPFSGDPVFTVTRIKTRMTRESPGVSDDRATFTRWDQSTTTPVAFTALMLEKTKI